MSERSKADGRSIQPSWGRLEQVIEQFEEAWQSGQHPAIDEYLKADDVEPSKLLVELAHADLECRLKAGEAARVEAYFERYAELAADRQTAIGLIAAEFNVRRRSDPNLSLEEYEQRFPEYRADLAERLRGPHPGVGHDGWADSDGGPLPFPIPSRLGQFELLQVIGQGAFGTVYRAHDVELDRIVAVKVPRGDRSVTSLDADRFVREARNAAQLSHAGIVPVYEVGREGTTPFIVSAYVEGITLAEAFSSKRLDIRHIAEVITQVAEALDHAHRQGVVHRDLKPSNIMLGQVQGGGSNKEMGRQGDKETRRPGDKETGRQGDREPQRGEEAGSLPVSLSTCLPLSLSGTELRAFVMDFGLARREEGEIRQTVDGQILGTPAYMSPEQAKGQSHHVDGRTDLYSLGVILYEMLTSELPFRGTTRMVLQQIMEEEPRPPRRLNDKIPRDLETIALKCMAKEPSRRYGTAAALAADLHRHLDGSPILARPVGQLERSWRWAKRNPRVAVLSAAVVLLLAALAIGSTAASIHSSRQRDEIGIQRDSALEARAQAEASAESARQHLELTLQTLDKLVYQVQEELRDQPALLALKEKLLQEALTGLQRVAGITKDADPSMGSAHERLGDIFLQLGRTAEAKQQYEHCLAIVERLAMTDALRAKSKRSLCVANAKLGEVSLRRNDLPSAEDYCRKAVAQAQELVNANPQSIQAARDLALCQNRLGQVELRRGDPTAAAESCRQAIEQAQTALASDPRLTDIKQDLVTSYEILGDARMTLRQSAEAQEAYGKVMELRLAMLKDQPNNSHAKRGLSVAYEKLGDFALRIGNVRGAHESYGKALAQREELAAAAPKNSMAQRDLSIAFGKLGEANERLRDVQKARECYDKACERLEGLASAYPDDAQIRRDRAVAYQKLGLIYVRVNEGQKAREYRRKAVAEFEALAKADRQNVQAQIDLVACCGSYGFVEMGANEFAAAAKHFERGVFVLKELEAQGKFTAQPVLAGWLRDQQGRLDSCKKAERAIDDLEFALGQPPQVASQLLTIRAGVLAGKGQHALAATTAAKLHELAPKDPTALYNVACSYALCIPAVAAGKQALSSEDKAMREDYTKRALDALTEAVARGYKDVAHMETDTDLAAIRKTSGYLSVVKGLKEGAKK